MINRIKELSNLSGVMGNDKAVRDYILNELKEYSPKVDNIGNIVVTKGNGGVKTLVCAHTDEVGFIATYIEDNGAIRFSTIGGVEPSVTVGAKMKFISKDVVGIIGVTPYHLLSQDERKAELKMSNFYLDIGTLSKEETLKKVSPGDTFTFDYKCEDFGDGKLMGKALDDRVGCGVLIEAIKNIEPKNETHFVFTTGEELGVVGATVVSNYLEYERAVVIECTTANDIGKTDGENKICSLGDGVVVSFMDNGCLYDGELYALCFDIAKNKNIKIQTKTKVVGGNDSKAVQKGGLGAKTIALSVPTRYIHSPSSVLKIDDILQTYKLLGELI